MRQDEKFTDGLLSIFHETLHPLRVQECERKVPQWRLIMVMESVYEAIGDRVNSLERRVS